jgi:hypothetical protein
LNACPDFAIQSFGWHKIVFGIRSLDEKVVLKVGTQKSIENDHQAYKRVPQNVRHQLFARIYWHTKYCLLQEYGFSAQITEVQLGSIRRIVNKYGIFDVKADNVKNIDGKLKLIDANATKISLPLVIQKIDEVRPKLPKRLLSMLQKITAFYQR